MWWRSGRSGVFLEFSSLGFFVEEGAALAGPEFGVFAVFGEKLFVGALLGDFATLGTTL